MEPGEEGTLGACAADLMERILERGNLDRARLKVVDSQREKH